jgi:hypothetical protein
LSNVSVVKPVVLGSYLTKAERDLVVECSFCKLVKWGCADALGFFKTMNLCSLDSSHCGFQGLKVHFYFVRGRGYRVEWICPKVSALAGKDGDVHG